MPFANIPVATTVVDSILFRDAFGTPAMRAVFCDHALIERYVEVEIALARAEGRTGVIPAAAAEEIAARTKPADFDFDHLRHETEIVGYPILPLVHQLSEAAGSAGRYVHSSRASPGAVDGLPPAAGSKGGGHLRAVRRRSKFCLRWAALPADGIKFA